MSDGNEAQVSKVEDKSRLELALDVVKKLVTWFKTQEGSNFRLENKFGRTLPDAINSVIKKAEALAIAEGDEFIKLEGELINSVSWLQRKLEEKVAVEIQLFPRGDGNNKNFGDGRRNFGDVELEDEEDEIDPAVVKQTANEVVQQATELRDLTNKALGILSE